MAAVSIDLSSQEEDCIYGEFWMPCRPAEGTRVNFRALEIQGLTAETAGSIWSRPHTEHDAFWALVAFLKDQIGETPDLWKRKIWAQYAAFDSGFLAEAAKRVPGAAGLFLPGRTDWCCTKELYKILQALGKVPMGSCSGRDMARVLGVENAQAHNALADARCTALCLRKMVEILEGRLTL